jgi:dihydroxy-acid dehydratase
MKSEQVKEGVERAPHRALLKACGYTDGRSSAP